MKKAMSINEALASLRDDEELKIKALHARQTKVMEIYTRLGKTNDKKNYMTEAKNMFYDSKFLESIDQKLGKPELHNCHLRNRIYSIYIVLINFHLNKIQFDFVQWNQQPTLVPLQIDVHMHTSL
jgi:hypothetical protein